MLKPSVKLPLTRSHPETEVLLCCARTCIDSERADKIQALLRKDVDWDYLLQTALLHGVMPLLYWNLNVTCPEAISKATLNQLQSHFRSNALNNFFLTEELLRLLSLFAAQEIRAIPFKGPVLAASAYGNLLLRQFGDLDILVHERDFLRAEDLLISKGYQKIPELELDWECHFQHAQSNVNVDLHRGMTPRYFPAPFDFDKLWEGLKPISLAGTMVPNLLPEDLLLVLCVQFSKDCCDRRLRLAQLCDVAELIRVHSGMNWERILAQSRTLGITRMLWLDLYLASELLGAYLPEEVLKRIHAEPVIKSLVPQVREWLLRGADSSPKSMNEMPFFTPFFYYPLHFQLRIRERLQDKALHCLYWLRKIFNWLSLLLYNAVTPNKNDKAFLQLPPFLYFLYYLIRPIRLIRQYRLGLIRRFLGI